MIRPPEQPLAEWEVNLLKPKVQLAVTSLDHQIMYYQVDDEWKINSATRCIVIGKFPRTYIPLDTVRSFTVESAE